MLVITGTRSNALKGIVMHLSLLLAANFLAFQVVEDNHQELTSQGYHKMQNTVTVAYSDAMSCPKILTLATFTNAHNTCCQLP